MDLRGSIPCFIRITAANVHDVNILDELLLQPGAFYVMDRAYTDFARLYTFTRSLAFFVVRAKSNLHYCRRAYRHVDKSTGLRSDHTILLQGPKTSQAYPDALRRISYVDTDTRKRLVFLTNNFSLPPLTIAHLYKCRWRVELFFKWIKQYLRIKAFFGTSQNAVKTQIVPPPIYWSDKTHHTEAAGVPPKTRRKAAGPTVTSRPPGGASLPRPRASPDAPASGSCCSGS